jgi:hypothetical protein
VNKDSFTLSKPVNTWKQWMAQKKRHYTTSKYYKPMHKFLLGLYSLSHFLFYPLLVLSCIFYDWQIALAVFGIRLLIQFIIYSRTMKKLGENDLLPAFLLFDLWMFVYYILFAPALLKKPKPVWK